jgi:hypothetical protein
MRVTTFSMAAMVLIAAGIAVFWPGRNAGPGLAAAVAQAPATGTADKQRSSAADRPLEAKLNERIDVDFVETPLKDALAYIQDRAHVPFYLKSSKLADAGINVDTPVSCNLKQVRLRTFLDLSLREIGLAYYDKDDLLVITTPDDAENTMEIRVYDCRDLLAMPEPAGGRRAGHGHGIPSITPDPAGLHPAPSFSPVPVPAAPRLPPPAIREGVPSLSLPPAPAAPPVLVPAAPAPAAPAELPRLPQSVLPQFEGLGGEGGSVSGGGTMPQKPLTEHELRAERLIDLITTNVDPDSWSDSGGAGSISEYHGLIVVTQTAQTHKKIEHVLNMLRQAADLDAPQGRVVR